MLIPSVKMSDVFLIAPVGIRDMAPESLIEVIVEGKPVAHTTRYVFVEVAGKRPTNRQFALIDGKEVNGYGLIFPSTPQLLLDVKLCKQTKTKNTPLGHQQLLDLKTRLVAMLDAAEATHG